MEKTKNIITIITGLLSIPFLIESIQQKLGYKGIFELTIQELNTVLVILLFVSIILLIVITFSQKKATNNTLNIENDKKTQNMIMNNLSKDEKIAINQFIHRDMASLPDNLMIGTTGTKQVLIDKQMLSLFQDSNFKVDSPIHYNLKVWVKKYISENPDILEL